MSKQQDQQNLHDVNRAWQMFRDLVHKQLPAQAKLMNQFAALANRRRTYR